MATVKPKQPDRSQEQMAPWKYLIGLQPRAPSSQLEAEPQGPSLGSHIWALSPGLDLVNQGFQKRTNEERAHVRSVSSTGSGPSKAALPTYPGLWLHHGTRFLSPPMFSLLLLFCVISPLGTRPRAREERPGSPVIKI